MFFIFPFFASAQVENVGDKRLTLYPNQVEVKIPYYGTHSLEEERMDIARAIIVVHGSTRNANSLFRNMRTALFLSDNKDSTLIIAPQFLVEEDIATHTLDATHLYWSGGWRSGDNSRTGSSFPRSLLVSSFTVLDTLIAKLASNYPNLRNIVFTGHSAGGQLTNRYAASTDIVEKLCEQYQIKTKFIVNNPSSYAYMDDKRRVVGTTDRFIRPATSCEEYNNWKFGLNNLHRYQAEKGAAYMRSIFKEREVVYLIGEEDTGTNLLDASCPARLQGTNRLQRAITYFNHLQDTYGESILEKHQFAIVPEAGHNSFDMFTSDIAQVHLFENEPIGCKNGTTSIEEATSHSTFSIYPNPATDYLYISANDHYPEVIYIYDATGKMVKQVKSNTSKISLVNLNAGFYFMAYVHEGRVRSQRFMKQ
ncbi:MAG: T9SS type A sorting domain-containing protein [Bacteroidota bacterium]